MQPPENGYYADPDDRRIRSSMKITIAIGTLAILCTLAVGAVAFELVQRGTSRETVAAAKAKRLDRHCAFMMVQAKTLVDELHSPLPTMRQAAAQGFENLAVNDLRELRLCVTPDVQVDPNDRALQCSREFDSDVPCMIRILETALAHWDP